MESTICRYLDCTGTLPPPIRTRPAFLSGYLSPLQALAREGFYVFRFKPCKVQEVGWNRKVSFFSILLRKLKQ
ncbi:hypothetical protein AVEN_267804-1 [Araneus ventricosus]|uniref:Uncharacterized protein n=1 Tax=Araneus ventricosus TaxID=182803 RepID=A0A4Y2D4J8_ARAVE|nr:hypothetical protein AVEN_267804-1 [Araneus ventricosus]